MREFLTNGTGFGESWAVRAGILLILYISGAGATVSTGYFANLNNYVIRDDYLVPLKFSGIGIDLGAELQWQKNRWSGNGLLSAGIGYIQNRFGHGGVPLSVSLKGHIAGEVYKSPSAGTFSISLPLNAGFNDYYMFSWDDAHLYWMTAHWAGLGIKYGRELSRNYKLSSWVSTPLLSLVGRPPEFRYNKQDALRQFSFYFTETEKNLTVEFPDKFRGIDAGLTIERPLKKSAASLSLAYSLFACYRGKKGYINKTGICFTQLWGGKK